MDATSQSDDILAVAADVYLRATNDEGSFGCLNKRFFANCFLQN